MGRFRDWQRQAVRRSPQQQGGSLLSLHSVLTRGRYGPLISLSALSNLIDMSSSLFRDPHFFATRLGKREKETQSKREKGGGGEFMFVFESRPGVARQPARTAPPVNCFSGICFPFSKEPCSRRSWIGGQTCYKAPLTAYPP